LRNLLDGNISDDMHNKDLSSEEITALESKMEEKNAYRPPGLKNDATRFEKIVAKLL